MILLQCPAVSCADTCARTHSTYSEKEGKEGRKEEGIFCNQRNGNMLLVRLMPPARPRGRGREGEWDWCVAVGKIWETAAAVRLNSG